MSKIIDHEGQLRLVLPSVHNALYADLKLPATSSTDGSHSSNARDSLVTVNKPSSHTRIALRQLQNGCLIKGYYSVSDQATHLVNAVRGTGSAKRRQKHLVV